VRRYHYVDLLRGIAALVVLIEHWRAFYSRFPGDMPPIGQDLGYPVMRPVWNVSEVAVPLFWALSGFVFAVAYGRYGKGLSIPDFWFRRFARLYPLHFATLLIVAGLQAYSMARFGQWQVIGNNDLPHFVLQLFLASNWFSMDYSFNAQIWSVSIEELIYFLFLIYLKNLGMSLPGALALAFAGFVIERLTHNQPAYCCALFFAGVAIAILRPRLRAWLLLIGLGGLGVTVAASFVAAALGQGDHLLRIWVYGGAPSTLALFIGLDERFVLPSQFHWFGLSTYSIYLLHFPILLALKMWVGIVPLPLFIAIVLPLAYLSYRWFELPAQRHLRLRWEQWRGNRRSQPEPAS
jgi:peptidoglycan/LPS O-acetylase OafA/YrhL